MAFKFRYSDADSTPAIEYIPATAAESYKVGETLVIGADGTATKASGATVPTYISCTDMTALGGELIPVVRIQKYMVFTVPLWESGDSLVRGEKVTIHADGLQVTSATADGVAEIVAFDGTAVGDTVAVRF